MQYWLLENISKAYSENLKQTISNDLRAIFLNTHRGPRTPLNLEIHQNEEWPDEHTIHTWPEMC